MTTPPLDELRATLVRALREVERLRKRVAELESPLEPIAIIGIGLRLPGGVANLVDLWQLLENETDAVIEVPRDRWDADAYYDPDPDAPGKTYVKQAGFLEHIDRFDARMFGISPREAKFIDPQHRILLEVAWESLENAGIPTDSLVDSKTGVFVGIGASDYGARLQDSTDSDAYALMGTHASFSAGRIAFHLGLQGPAVSTDTACSSSLVALHLACQSLRSGECSLALAGGTAAMSSPRTFALLSRTHALSPSGRSKTFSDAADGYGRGEGAIVLVLERLADARAKGRRIHALIRGSAVNHDGTSSGITAPNGTSQQKVLRAALDDAGLSPRDIDVVECHGTGTRLGDPIEVQALAGVYGEGRSLDQPLLLGTIKTNIGHLEAASGLAGVAKLIVAMQHDSLPSSIHALPLNTHIDWPSLPLQVVTSRRNWPRPVKRAGVSAFGLSGTNAHVLLEQAPPKLEHAPRTTSQPRPMPFVVSGHNDAALRAQARRIVEFCVTHPELEPRDIALSLATTRTQFNHRACVVAANLGQLTEGLLAIADSGRHPSMVEARVARRPRLGFMFTGQGAQRPELGRVLYESHAVFREVFDALCAAFDALLPRRLRELMFATPDSDDAALLNQTAYTQPALFVFEVALYRQLEAWGLRPDFVLGHSIGELAAAHVAGVWSLEHACKLVAARGRLMQALPEGGAMASIQASESEILAALASVSGVSIAGLNGPMSTVISGDEQPIEQLVDEFAARGRKVQRLVVSHAFHSARMDPMLREFEAVFATLDSRPPAGIALISNVTGRVATARELCTAEYWSRQVRAPVRFTDGVQTLADKGVTLALELGPHGVLSAMGSACIVDDRIAFVAGSRRDRDEHEALMTALAEVHCRGIAVDWRAFFANTGARWEELPVYAFQRERYWFDTGLQVTNQAPAGRFTLAGQRIDLPDRTIVHTVEIGPRLQAGLEDHVIYGHIVVPAALYLATLLATAESHWPGRDIEIIDAQFVRALTFESAHESTKVYVRLQPLDDGHYAAELYTRDPQDGEWRLHCSAKIGPADSLPGIAPLPESARALGLNEFRSRVGPVLSDLGIDWGPSWWLMAGSRSTGAGRELGRLDICEDEAEVREAPLTARVLDNAFGLLRLAVEFPTDGVARLPFAVDQLVWRADAAAAVWAETHSATGFVDSEHCKANVDLWDSTGSPIAVVRGFTLRRAPNDRIVQSRAGSDLYRIAFERRSLGGELPTRVWLLGEGPLHKRLEERLQGAVELHQRGLNGLTHDLGDLLPTHIIVTPGADEPLAACAGLLELLQAWADEPRLSQCVLVVLTSMAVAVDASEVVTLAHAPIWGMVRTVQTELSEFADQRLVLVDIDDPSPRLLDLIDGAEPQVVLRRDECFVPRLTPLAVDSGPRKTFDDIGTVMITGGSGGLGGLLAEHLVRQHGVRHLLLVSRRGANTPGADHLRESLAAAGAVVEFAAIDVADRESLRQLLAGIPKERPLQAVVHTAGVLDDGLFGSLDARRLANVFRAKLDAAKLLDELVDDPAVGFVLFSSFSGLLGHTGQANYAAANTYLDALAADRRRRGRQGLSLAWGPWLAGGMAARLTDADRDRMARQGVRPFASDEALALFDASLGATEALVIPVRLDRVQLRARAMVPALLSTIIGVVPQRRVDASRASGSLRARLSSIPSEARAAAMIEFVRFEVASVFGISDARELDDEQPLQELGLDSLLAVELRNHLQQQAELRLSATLLFDYPTIGQIAEMLLDKLQIGPAVASVQPSAPAALAHDDAIAIVAMACRLPGHVNTPEDLWDLLIAEREGIGPFPNDRGWEIDKLYDSDPNRVGTTYTKGGGFIDNHDRFDAGFFGISPREAVTMDPQHRLLLEVAWEAIERAGIEPSTLRETRTSVFVGEIYRDYLDLAPPASELADGYPALGSAPAILSGRLSYFLGLHGPAVSLDTACSTSLVATHLACQSLRSGESSLALVGGTTVFSTFDPFIIFSRLKTLAPDGRSKAFSEQADGAGWSEGVGLVVLERLVDARAKGHPVLALVRGTAVNQDGRSQGMTAPNGPSQQRVIQQALDAAKLGPADVHVVEGHGTGTGLGDPIEVHALQAVYGAGHSAERPLWLGTIKSNVGHTQAAAGVAGMIKMVLALQHRILPRTLHAEQPSTHIDWADESVKLLQEAIHWPEDAGPLRAGVSAFGLSGTNAHVILESVPPEPPGPLRSTQIPMLPVLLSGHSSAALAEQAGKLAQHLSGNSTLDVRDVAMTLATARSRFGYRACVVASTNEELRDGLIELRDSRSSVHVVQAQSSRNPKIAYMFTGQGAQRLSMGAGLREVYPSFRTTFDDVYARFDQLLDKPLREVVFGKDGAELDQTAYTQPALFALEVALVRLLESWGIVPNVLLGHSIGELVAAFVAGVFSLDDACKLVAARGRLMQALPAGGAMVSLQASEADVLPMLEQHPGVDIAGLNGPMSTVISGDEAPVLALAAAFEARGRKTRRLAVSHAFHSQRMDPMLDAFRAIAASVRYHAPTIAIVSNVTGKLATEEEMMSPEYWVQHVRSAVRFFDGVRTLEAQGVRVCLELGPHGVLSSMAAECLSAVGQNEVALVPALRRDRSEPEALSLALGGLHCRGVAVDWQRYFEPHSSKRVLLPTYAFQRERHWLEHGRNSATVPSSSAGAGDAPFWAAVDLADLDSLSAMLGIDEVGRASLASLLPSLGKWRHGQSRRSKLANWRYRVQWRRTEPPPRTRAFGTWIVAVPEVRSDLVDSVLAGLAKMSGELVRLELSQHGSRSQLVQQLEQITSKGAIAGIVSLAALAPNPGPQHVALPIGLAHDLALMQAVLTLDLDLRVWMLTSSAISVGIGDNLAMPAQALTWGLRRAASLEHPRRVVGSVDLSTPLDIGQAEALAAFLLGDVEDQLALRGEHWYVPRLSRAPLADKLTRFKGKGTALITGGTGALGARAARWLIARGVEHVVLTSRRGGDAPDAVLLRQELEQLGARVTVESCDSSVREQLAALLAKLDAEGNRPATIVHAAGVDGRMTPLAELSESEFAEVAAAKVAGAQHLHELTSAYELDAFILFASIAGVWGSARQVAYASANAYLDALAQHRAHAGMVATSIAWGPWSGGGMADEKALEQLTRVGLSAMDPLTAIEGLDVASEGEPSMTMVDVEWTSMVVALASGRARPFFAELVAPADSNEPDVAGHEPLLTMQLRPLAEADRYDYALAIVNAQTAAVLGFKPGVSLNPETGFADLGIDSLMAVELRQCLQRVTGFELPATLTFDYPSPARATQLLLELCADALNGAQTEALAGPDEAGQSARDAEDAEFDELDEDDMLDAAKALLGE